MVAQSTRVRVDNVSNGWVQTAGLDKDLGLSEERAQNFQPSRDECTMGQENQYLMEGLGAKVEGRR